MKEAMKLALEAFKEIADETYDSWTNGAKAQRIAQAMIPKLEEALAKQEQGEQDNYQGSDAAKAAHMMDLYTALGVKWGEDPFAVIAKMRDQQPKQEQKYRRGDRLVCLETDEFCVIHISGVDRQWVKFPDSHIGVYTNDQIADMFELLAKEQEQKRPQNCGTSYCSCIECVMEQEQGEPVAWACVIETADFEQDTVTLKMMDNNYSVGAGLHWLSNITPQQRKPLTDEQIEKLFEPMTKTGWSFSPIGLARIIEAAHGIKEKNNA